MENAPSEWRRHVLQELAVESELVSRISPSRREWWWQTSCDELGGISPREAVIAGHFEKVLELVRGYS